MNTTVFQEASFLEEQHIPFILLTITKTEGSASRTFGTALYCQGRNPVGTIGGGALEAFAFEQAKTMLQVGEQLAQRAFHIDQLGHKAGTVHLAFVHSNLAPADDFFAQLATWQQRFTRFVLAFPLVQDNQFFAMSEQGAMLPQGMEPMGKQAAQALEINQSLLAADCFYSLPVSPFNLVLVGGGHVNQAIAKLATFVGFSYRIIETRAEYATFDLFPEAISRLVAPTISEALAQVVLNPHTGVVIASHTFSSEVAKQLLASPISYLGVLGSRFKAKNLITQLGLDHTYRGKLHTPIGLDLGSETPEEIALSVIAEMTKQFKGTTGNNLSHLASRLVIVRGGGDLATGVIVRLYKAGFKVLVLEVEKPTVIRTTVSLAQAMYSGQISLEGVQAVRCTDIKEASALLQQDKIPLLCDPEGTAIEALQPVCVVDAILAKKNLGTNMDMAPLVIALGPGFTASLDCDAVIETKRGHSLGRIITEGCAIPNTGVPGVIAGYGKERVIHSPASGNFQALRQIGDLVTAGDIIAKVGDVPVQATISGMIRGMLNSGLKVPTGFKIADIDPRGLEADYTTISDKARAIGGSVLEALDAFLSKI